MSAGEIVGTFGVSILLIAFALNLAGKLSASSVPYLLMNIVGAALAGVSSYRRCVDHLLVYYASSNLKKITMFSPLRLFLFMITSLTFFTSCRNYKEVQITGVKGFNVNKINAEGIDGDILIGIKNPNNFGFSIYKSEFDVNYSGVYLGKAKLTKRVRISANKEEVYSFNLKNDFKGANLSDVMKLLGGAMFKNTIEVTGNLKVGKFYVKKKIPVKISEKIKLN